MDVEFGLGWVVGRATEGKGTVTGQGRSGLDRMGRDEMGWDGREHRWRWRWRWSTKVPGVRPDSLGASHMGTGSLCDRKSVAPDGSQ